MSNSLFITATEAGSGKSLVSLGMMELLHRKIKKIAFFRPIVNDYSQPEAKDDDIHLISSYFKLGIPYHQMYGYKFSKANDLISEGKKEEMFEGLMEKFNELREEYDFVLCEGTDFSSSSMAFEFDINAEISKNLGCPVLLVANAYRKTADETVHSIELAIDSLRKRGCQTIATIVNRQDTENKSLLFKLLKERKLTKGQMVDTIPDEEFLAKPTLEEIAKFFDAEVLLGKDKLNRPVRSFSVAAMQLRNFLSRVENGALIVAPGDRADVIVACLAASVSSGFENMSGLLLTGGLKPEESVWRLIKGLPEIMPVISVKEDTFQAVSMMDKIEVSILPNNQQKITLALAAFEKNVDVERLGKNVITTKTSVVTPKMFQFELIQKAKKNKQHIVLPEGADERILRAAEILLRREVVDITLLGDETLIKKKLVEYGLELGSVKIMDPAKSEFFTDYVKIYYDLRKHKGVTMENAQDTMLDVNYFGTMMVYKGHADGMVSGAVHSTAATIRPAFEIIKIKPNFSIVSGIFFMCLEDKVLVYGDCAVNPNPNAEQLAEIAISSAQTAKIFGIAPVVAMLSYSTGRSGKGVAVEAVCEATRIAKEKAKKFFPTLKLDGPIQYDAAVDPAIAKSKMPESEVAGNATVFIFPDLNTGNNTYKAVQRSAGAVAIGPVLQGLKRPVNDLSRGCTIPDIVNTVAITAIQAQSKNGDL